MVLISWLLALKWDQYSGAQEVSASARVYTGVMGMFDTLVCEYPLPDPVVQENEFQTKSLESLMERYTITRAGRLVHHAELRERREDKSVPWGFSVELVDAWDEDTGFHGELEFYAYVDGVSYTYRARFGDGQLRELRRVDEEDTKSFLHPVTNERSRRYSRVFKKAVAVFGDADGARGWLWVPHASLEGRTPLEVAGSEEGAARVLALLSGTPCEKS